MRMKIQITIDGVQESVKTAAANVLNGIGYADGDALGAVTRAIIGDKVKLGGVPTLENHAVDARALLTIE